MKSTNPESTRYNVPASNLHRRICQIAECSNLVIPATPGDCLTCSEVAPRDVVYSLRKCGRGCNTARIGGVGIGILKRDGSFLKQG